MKFGFFDSGLGGLLMMQSCQKKFPHYNYIYVGDTCNLPYGPRDSTEIEFYMSPYLIWMIEEKKCDYVFIACNTASAKALPLFKKKYPQYADKTIGIIEPTIKYIQEQKNIDSLLILGTEGTIKSKIYINNLDISIRQAAMPGLVELIEKGKQEEAQLMLQDILAYYPHNSHILLACTHYVALIDFLSTKYSYTIISQDIILQDIIDTLSIHHQNQIWKKGTNEYYLSGDIFDYRNRYNLEFKKLLFKK